VKIETINERSDDNVRIKVECIDELKHSSDGVKIKIEPTNQLKHFDSELKGKIDELKFKINSKFRKVKEKKVVD